MTISICIPTYNRASYLSATLESIAQQWGPDIEITIADNASTDNTKALVDQYRDRLGRVRYFCWDSNQGADRNFLKSVEIASGEYCWILGSDDPIAVGAINILRISLKEKSPDVLLFNRVLCDRNLHAIYEDRIINIGNAQSRDYDFRQSGELNAYLNQARSMCAIFSYLSAMVFRKEVWDRSTEQERFIGTAYVHAYKILTACVAGARLTYLNQGLVMCRLGNDSFRDAGLAQRVLLDLNGYKLLAEYCLLGTTTSLKHEFLAVLRLEYPFFRIMRYQKVLGRDPHWPDILALLQSLAGYSTLTLRLATFLGKSRPLVNLSFFLRDAMQKRSRQLPHSRRQKST